MNRYLTKLTQSQICLMNEEDLEKFAWTTGNDPKVHRSRYFNTLRVCGSEEGEEDFKLSAGFTVSIIGDYKDILCFK